MGLPYLWLYLSTLGFPLGDKSHPESGFGRVRTRFSFCIYFVELFGVRDERLQNVRHQTDTLATARCKERREHLSMHATVMIMSQANACTHLGVWIPARRVPAPTMRMPPPLRSRLVERPVIKMDDAPAPTPGAFHKNQPQYSTLKTSQTFMGRLKNKVYILRENVK